MTSTKNADPAELAKFSELASRWWDTESEFKPLHQINPLRLAWMIEQTGSISGQKIADIGCGGGILSDSLAASGAQVTGIDLSEKALSVARLHQLESGQDVEYLHVAAEDFAAQRPGSYDIVTCMEMLEHVPNPLSTIKACSQLVRPGGWVFFSTLNRNFKAYLFAIIGAEYVLKLLPRGTHEYSRFIKPSELASLARQTALDPVKFTGMHYNPFSQIYSLGDNLDVNYILACRLNT